MKKIIITIMLSIILLPMIVTKVYSATKNITKADNHFTATIYEFESDKKKPLFQFSHTKDPIKKTVIGIYTSLDKQEIAKEVSNFDEKDNLKKYFLTEAQINLEATLEVTNNGKEKTVSFIKTRDGKTKTAKETHPNDTVIVVGPSIIQYLQKHWQELITGNTLSIRFASVERLETLAFEINKIADTTFANKPAMQLKMRPTNFIIAALLGHPIIFTFTPDGKRLLEFTGRTILKEKRRGSWHDLDADTVYSYL